MKRKLTAKETVFVASMLFGMLFGAGNLIFPVSMGQMAGSQVWKAAAGFLVTAVGIPLLGVIALGVSRKEGLLELSSMVGRKYGIFFTCALYLTIGPFFAIPRCATVSFTVGGRAFIPAENEIVALGIFSLLFFALVLYFSLRPGQILTWVGKVLNPLFLCFLGLLLIRALLSPMGAAANAEPVGAYAEIPLFQGFLEGYNTMDVLAGLAFGIIVVNVIRSLGVAEPAAVAANTIKSGFFSCLLMGGIYVLVAVVGAQSRSAFEASANGGEGLADIAGYYFGKAGTWILAVTVTLACLKTAVGLITSCGETFEKMFSKGPSYKIWTIIFCSASFLIANLGLNKIIAFSVPVLMFLYPLAVTLILLAVIGKIFSYDRKVFVSVTVLTLLAAVLDFMNALPKETIKALHLSEVIRKAQSLLPLSDIGFGWLLPALVGLVIGLAWRMAGERGKTQE